MYAIFTKRTIKCKYYKMQVLKIEAQKKPKKSIKWKKARKNEA